MPWHRRLPFYYGWVIVAVAFVCFAVGYATQHSFSIFFVAILEEFGWSRAVTAGALSLFFLVYGAYSIVAGGMVDRFGPRVALPVGALILGAGLLAITRLSTVWQFYLLYGVVAAVGLTSFGSVPTFTILNGWFVKKRGTAGGLATSGIGVGMFLFVPLLQTVISNYGWRAAYLVLAAGTVAVIPTLAFVFFRHRPQDMGLLPDGADPAEGEASKRAAEIRAEALVVDKEWAATDWTLGLAVRTRRFWFILFGRFLELAPVQLVLAHQAAYFVDAGFDKLLAASVVGTVGIVGSGGKIFWGVVSDRIGRELSFTLACTAGTIGLVMLLSIGPGTPIWMLYAYAIVYGVCYGASAVLLPVLSADVFHSRRYGTILGGIYVGGGIGSAIGAFFGGYVFDVTGSYTQALVAVIPVMWTACLLYWLAGPRKVRLVAGKARKVASLQTQG